MGNVVMVCTKCGKRSPWSATGIRAMHGPIEPDQVARTFERLDFEGWSEPTMLVIVAAVHVDDAPRSPAELHACGEKCAPESVELHSVCGPCPKPKRRSFIGGGTKIPLKKQREAR